MGGCFGRERVLPIRHGRAGAAHAGAGEQCNGQGNKNGSHAGEFTIKRQGGYNAIHFANGEKNGKE